MPSQDYFLYLKQAGLLEAFTRVHTCCRILGLDVDQLSIQTTEEAWKRQLSSPGVHSALAREMTEAKEIIVKWIEDNPMHESVAFAGGTD
ncbi:MAG: hypothetical protein KGS72_20495 [Cyanobacteria bacterium REEB67]|nr:hypothetical protein [Cyanobacteria bacterium REEB67]